MKTILMFDIHFIFYLKDFQSWHIHVHFVKYHFLGSLSKARNPWTDQETSTINSNRPTSFVSLHWLIKKQAKAGI